MTSRYEALAALHIPGDPVILYNIWDVGSAQAVVRAGARAIATGSHPVADAHGWPDGEQVPLDFALANAARIVAAVDLPVTVDFESGYAIEPEAVEANLRRLADTGAVGCNFEDQVIGGEGLHPTDAQCRRIAAARRGAGDAFFINARTDLFLKSRDHDWSLVDQVIERGKAFADSGASGFFVPRFERAPAGGAGGARGALAAEPDRLPRRPREAGLGRRRGRAHQPRPLPASRTDAEAGGNGPRGDRLISRRLPAARAGRDPT